MRMLMSVGVVSYHMKSNYDAAIRDYDAALRIDPNYQLARSNRELALKAKNGQ